MNSIKKITNYVFDRYKVTDKVAFFINEEYIFDHYSCVMERLDSNIFDIILADKFKQKKYGNLINKLTLNSWNVMFLSDVLYLRKYKVLLTHLYLGGNTASSGTIFLRVKSIIFKLMKTIGIKWSKELPMQYFQNILGVCNIRFMYGADAGVNSFYEYGNNYSESFDIFFCHGPRDAEITKSMFDKPIFIMGYPRYDKFFERNGDLVYKNNLCEKYLIDNKKKTILWITTVNKHFSTIETYSERMKSLLSSYNVIVRPHPLEIDPEYDRYKKNVHDIVNSGKFIISSDPYQEMSDLYLMANFVFCDYGGSIFSALYMGKRIILLNHKEVEKDLVVSSSTSMEAREYFPSINQDEDNLFSYFDMDWTQCDKARDEAVEHYFGKINTDASKRAALYLTNMLRQ